ncbi:MAG: F0F1 ATP synthase subunit B [Bacteroidia bacterium]|nr:F0F1 ATP synthase subunit B [Bacteroidia bacterium]
MELIKPEFGLLFWMAITFLIVLFLLKKFAWKPILQALKEREESIQSSLDEAKTARQEMANLVSDNERLLNEARAERDVILKEAREAKDKIISEARERASVEETRLLGLARQEIQNEKMAAITELKNQVASMSIDIAEKIIKQRLSNDDAQKQLVTDLVEEASVN